MARRYDLLAVDLDGTLLNHAGRVGDDDLAALRTARAAGMVVTVCTGRALGESAHILEAIEQVTPVVVSGGAMVACPVTGATLERFTLEREFVEEAVEFLAERGHAALILKDPHATSLDYLVVGAEGEAGLDRASRWWFGRNALRVKYARTLDLDEHHEHSVRIGAYRADEPVEDLAAALRERFGGEAALQHFCGVLPPGSQEACGLSSVHIVELFHPRVDKWQAIERLCGRLGVDAARTAAIGDQRNDLEMITHAGLGVAMANAHADVRAAADRTTGDNESGGVAAAVERILSGEW
ncbi:Cof-type HAD-IIB family hydrolase [soil metagenome]